ncbi:DORMANCY-ASSOCIATED PROTEIN-like protein 4 [Salix viminalis]|uniref:DORMANCY-ASSOCIATED PROTEIN-like protein 4 n=1 Tax=Salix viminalis TaxID=40686 RepID=A0A9Q0TNM4_SALVM|nr:DORMANCY-ASSOCIATED PROTEIN-like protein 4 [Salix viminalis]
MGFLHKLWDETLAGPMPDSGLGKLRKYDSFSARSSPPVNASAASRNGEMNVTRSITIIRRISASSLRNLSVDPGSAPESPAPPSTPETPLTPGTPRGDFRRRKSSVEASESAEPRSLITVHEWIVLNPLDR